MRPLWNKDPVRWDKYADLVIVVVAFVVLAAPLVYEWALK